MPKEPTGVIIRPEDFPAFCGVWGPDLPDGMTTTCLRPSGHTGPHEWTRDDTVIIGYGEDDL